MEQDADIKGEKLDYSTEFRQYDPRVGRWFSPDPVVKPWESPYASFSNNPIRKIDPLGLDPKPKVAGTEGQTIPDNQQDYEWIYHNGDWNLHLKPVTVSDEQTGGNDSYTVQNTQMGNGTSNYNRAVSSMTQIKNPPIDNATRPIRPNSIPQNSRPNDFHSLFPQSGLEHGLTMGLGSKMPVMPGVHNFQAKFGFEKEGLKFNGIELADKNDMKGTISPEGGFALSNGVAGMSFSTSQGTGYIQRPDYLHPIYTSVMHEGFITPNGEMSPRFTSFTTTTVTFPMRYVPVTYTVFTRQYTTFFYTTTYQTLSWDGIFADDTTRMCHGISVGYEDQIRGTPINLSLEYQKNSAFGGVQK